MSIHNTIIHSSGEILTGRLWREDHHSFFNNLPFYTNIPRMDDMASPLMGALDNDGGRCQKALLAVCLLLFAVLLNLTAFNRNLPRV